MPFWDIAAFAVGIGVAAAGVGHLLQEVDLAARETVMVRFELGRAEG